MRHMVAGAILTVGMTWGASVTAGALDPNVSTSGGGFVGGTNVTNAAFGLSGNSCVAGEGAAPNGAIVTGGAPPGAVTRMDWVVCHDPANSTQNGSGNAVALGTGVDDYLYFYQFENPSVAGVFQFVIQGPVIGELIPVPTSVGFALGTQGFLTGVDLDLIHNGATFANLLGTEQAEGTIAPQDPSNVFVSTLIATFTPSIPCANNALSLCPTGQVGESSTVVVRGTAPTYDIWTAQGDAGNQWSSESLNPGQPASLQGLRIASPGPVSEPGSLALLGVGFALAGTIVRRRRRKA